MAPRATKGKVSKEFQEDRAVLSPRDSETQENVQEVIAQLKKHGMLTLKQLQKATRIPRNTLKRHAQKMEVYGSLQVMSRNGGELTLHTEVALADWAPLEQMIREEIERIQQSGERVTLGGVAERVGRLESDGEFVATYARAAKQSGLWTVPKSTLF